MALVRLSLTHADQEEILWPVFKQVVFPMIEASEGAVREADLAAMYREHGNVGLGGIICTVMEEVVSLHLYLDTLDKRPEIMKTYQQIFMKAGR